MRFHMSSCMQNFPHERLILYLLRGKKSGLFISSSPEGEVGGIMQILPEIGSSFLISTSTTWNTLQTRSRAQSTEHFTRISPRAGKRPESRRWKNRPTNQLNQRALGYLMVKYRSLPVSLVWTSYPGGSWGARPVWTSQKALDSASKEGASSPGSATGQAEWDFEGVTQMSVPLSASSCAEGRKVNAGFFKSGYCGQRMR